MNKEVIINKCAECPFYYHFNNGECKCLYDKRSIPPKVVLGNIIDKNCVLNNGGIFIVLEKNVEK